MPAIRGYLNPATGQFTTRIAPDANAQPGALPEATTHTGTALFFREDFQITVQNYDQPSNATAVCEVYMSTYEGGNDDYSDDLSVPATATSGGWTCDVPILTQWTLQTPTQDTISASVSISIYSQSTPVPIGRSATQSFTFAVPANTQTITNTVNFRL